MAYTDPRHVFEYTNAAGTTLEVEAAAAICKRVGRVADAGTAASAALDGVRCPAGCDIEDFGLLVTEAITNANATHFIIALKVVAVEGGSATTVAQITLPKDSTEVTTDDVRPSDRTAAQAVAVGARFRSSDVDLPYKVPQGGHFYVEVTQAAGAAGGAVRPFVVARFPGSVAPTTASPVTSIAS